MNATALRIARAQSALLAAEVEFVSADLRRADLPTLAAPADDAPDAEWSAWSAAEDDQLEASGYTAAYQARCAAEDELLRACEGWCTRAAPVTGEVFRQALLHRQPARRQAVDLMRKLDARTVRL